MTMFFDVIVVGSGPAAIASVDAIDRKFKVACITGAVPSSVRNSSLHPKIRAVSSTTNEPAGVAEVLQAHGGTIPLFSTAAVGGLTNYWGQQFKAANCNDPWPRALFGNHLDYLAECERVESRFQIDGGVTLEHPAVSASGFVISTPRLLTSPSRLQSRPAEMTAVFRELVALGEIEVFDARVVSITETPNGSEIKLHDGRQLLSDKLIMAAGVIGNARIILRSFADLRKASFKDHTPWMLYTLGIGAILPRSANLTAHFNQFTLEQIEGDETTVFASIYNMRYADLNLLFASTIGFTSRILGRFEPAAPASILRPIQVWTKSTENLIEINRAGESTNYDIAPEQPQHIDTGLESITNLVRENRGRVLRTSRTRPGYGFHYHALSFSTANGKPVPVGAFLRERTGGKVICVDASSLESIGCRPPTLTAMASARRITRTLISEKAPLPVRARTLG